MYLLSSAVRKNEARICLAFPKPCDFASVLLGRTVELPHECGSGYFKMFRGAQHVIWQPGHVEELSVIVVVFPLQQLNKALLSRDLDSI